MMTKILTTVFLGLSMCAFAQDPPSRMGHSFPITVSIFSESVGLGQFGALLKKPHLGFRIGTELYYSKNAKGRMLQTLHVGYYHHKDFQSGFFLSSEVGYRKFIHHTFMDITAGVGYLRINSALPRYVRAGEGFQVSGSTFGRLMPTVGLGLGHQFERVSLFSRYELFGEAPFGFRGIPVLPHQALHVGTRFNFN